MRQRKVRGEEKEKEKEEKQGKIYIWIDRWWWLFSQSGISFIITGRLSYRNRWSIHRSMYGVVVQGDFYRLRLTLLVRHETM